MATQFDIPRGTPELHLYNVVVAEIDFPEGHPVWGTMVPADIPYNAMLVALREYGEAVRPHQIESIESETEGRRYECRINDDSTQGYRRIRVVVIPDSE